MRQCHTQSTIGVISGTQMIALLTIRWFLCWGSWSRITMEATETTNDGVNGLAGRYEGHSFAGIVGNWAISAEASTTSAGSIETAQRSTAGSVDASCHVRDLDLAPK